MDILAAVRRMQLPLIYATENEKDPLVRGHFFSSKSGWSWYPIEFDGKETFFGLVKGFETELGYFGLHDLISANFYDGVDLQCESPFEPIRLSELKAKLARES